MFKNSTERAFVLVLLMCGFVALWIMVQDLAFGA
jgi:preprotein translocase subunit SecE